MSESVEELPFQGRERIAYKFGLSVWGEFHVFLGDSIVFWFFGICFAAGIGTGLTLLELIRKQVNRVLPEGKRFKPQPRWPRTWEEYFFGTHVVAHYRELLDQHRKYYPTSVLPKTVSIASLSIVPSFIGYVISALLSGLSS